MRHALSFAAAAGLLVILSTSSARAQAAYGYDSWIYNVPSSSMYWNGTGYTGVYTDRSTGIFAGSEFAPYRGVAPYGQPPVGAFGQNNGLSVATVPAAGATPVQQQPAKAQRRPLLKRLRARR